MVLTVRKQKHKCVRPESLPDIDSKTLPHFSHFPWHHIANVQDHACWVCNRDFKWKSKNQIGKATLEITERVHGFQHCIGKEAK